MYRGFGWGLAGGMLAGLILGSGIAFFRVWHDYCLIPSLPGF